MSKDLLISMVVTSVIDSPVVSLRLDEVFAGDGSKIFRLVDSTSGRGVGIQHADVKASKR